MELLRSILFEDSGKLTLVGHLLTILAIIVVAVILIRILELMLDKAVKKAARFDGSLQKTKTLVSVLKSFLKVFILLFAAIAILDDLGVNTRSILAVAGIGGVAIAFAAQSIVRDVINGAFMLFENQFNIHDFVTIDGSSGTVIDMGIRTVKLQDIDGAVHIIPNGSISKVINHSVSDMRVAVDIKVPSRSEVDVVKDIINKSLDRIYENNRIFEIKPYILGIGDLNGLTYNVMVWSSAKAGSQYEGQRLLKEEIMKDLQAQGIFNRLEDKSGKV